MKERLELKDVLGAQSYDSDSDNETEGKPIRGLKTNKNPKKTFLNRQRTLILCERTTKGKHREVMNDLLSLMPHGKSVAKLDQKHKYDLSAINDLCMMKNCTNAIYFQTKGEDCWCTIAKSPKGPTISFKMFDITTTKQLKLTGNCLKGSRPVLHFDKSMTETPLGLLYKELFTQVFATPPNHPKSKPFVDHMFCFYLINGRIMFRNYQVFTTDRLTSKAKELIEIGPRFTMEPVRVLEGAFHGKTIYNNNTFEDLRVKSKKNRQRLRAERKAEFEMKRNKRLLLQKEVNEIDAVFLE